MNGPGPFGQPVQNSTPVEGGGCDYCMHMSVLAPQKHSCVTSVGVEYIHILYVVCMVCARCMHGVCMVCAWCVLLHFTCLRN